jgi:hypothetical protein
LLPESLLRYSVRGERVVPHFLDARDHPWLRVLLDERDRLAGRRQRELDARLAEPLSCPAPEGKRRLAVRVLRRLAEPRRAKGVPPRKARRLVFGEAARSGDDRAAVLDRVAHSLGVSTAELEDALFGDLPGERMVVPLDPPLAPQELALRANLVLVQALLFRATAATIDLDGNARAVVRHAKLHGLICQVAGRQPGADAATMDLSGPLSIFQRTLIYGRALSRVVPFLAWCRRFRLRATCLLGERLLRLDLASGDPFLPSAEPREYDSRLEERFARDLRRAAPDWDVIREPEPVRAGHSLCFPDFALVHRVDPSRRWLVEIVGFWTPEYLARKLALYRAAEIENLILCIDEDRQCAEADLPAGARILRFRRRIDVAVVVPLLS